MAVQTHDHKSLCANCQNPGSAACTNCRLVTYCGKQCQTTHWQAHRSDCKSIRRAQSWQPGWVTENRQLGYLPGYGPNANKVQQITTEGNLWGNMPALDVLQLRSNEGEFFNEDIKLLFAASGDLRNVIKTFAALPKSYNGTLTVTINDHDPLVVARNIIICVLAVSIDDADLASECITHVWYSAFRRQVDLDLLHTHVLPLAKEVCLKIADKSLASLQAKTWRVRKCSLRLIMSKQAWQLLLACLRVRPELTPSQAQTLRLAAIDKPEGQDSRDLGTLRRLPVHRISRQRFRDDGMALPFGHSRKTFVIPNPTLHQADTWPLTSDEDPIRGWGLANVFSTSCGNATNDLTGKLYCHVRPHIQSFHKHLSERGASFEFFSMDAAQLPGFLPKSAFARIEVSNVCDMPYLGPERTISTLAPLLQRPSVNPHATLLTCFMHAVDEVQNNRPPSIPEQKEFKRIALERLCQYQSMLKLVTIPAVFDPMISAALPHVRDDNALFEQYCDIFDFSQIAVSNRLKIKAENTIVEKWPMALKLKLGEAGFEDEFAMLLGSAARDAETYVEWASLE